MNVGHATHDPRLKSYTQPTELAGVNYNNRFIYTVHAKYSTRRLTCMYTYDIHLKVYASM